MIGKSARPEQSAQTRARSSHRENIRQRRVATRGAKKCSESRVVSSEGVVMGVVEHMADVDQNNVRLRPFTKQSAARSSFLVRGSFF